MDDFIKGAVFMAIVMSIAVAFVAIPIFLAIKFGWIAVVTFIMFIGGLANVYDNR